MKNAMSRLSECRKPETSCHSQSQCNKLSREQKTPETERCSEPMSWSVKSHSLGVKGKVVSTFCVFPCLILCGPNLVWNHNGCGGMDAILAINWMLGCSGTTDSETHGAPTLPIRLPAEGRLPRGSDSSSYGSACSSAA